METKQEHKNFCPLILTGPSGVGKSSIKNIIIEKDERFAHSISATERMIRRNENDGVDYYFFNNKQFDKAIKNNEFFEWQTVYRGVRYGTLKSEIERILSICKVPILDVDVYGTLALKSRGENFCSIALTASIDNLTKRLDQRKTETLGSKIIRLDKAPLELELIKGNSNFFDLIIPTDISDEVTLANRIVHFYKHFLSMNKRKVAH